MSDDVFFAMCDSLILEKMGYSQLFIRFMEKFHLFVATRLLDDVENMEIETPPTESNEPQLPAGAFFCSLFRIGFFDPFLKFYSLHIY